ncbi:hypothetical protein [Shewanella saliphila]|uniref:hypothetical protein n=1 Tax=Shewanella saliphila TaxID=2282698 RepID=UPI001666D683|nr:hypothetical protein [Shewanella saliphila]MCL1100316.1 hypothetical protein [Shewanella saliphila]
MAKPLLIKRLHIKRFIDVAVTRGFVDRQGQLPGNTIRNARGTTSKRICLFVYGLPQA